ncbi:hypothetical protein EVAR_2544_1 [Eumeta japonica]|uniref:Uncharacterized protein n=1 Tax=Eumeta variegata TaxID=151549 RepID=A0A4C1SRK2_EUMVA|nr:hypothetical protein EVAR_2544_1 [Eumeta japonica]
MSEKNPQTLHWSSVPKHDDTDLTLVERDPRSALPFSGFARMEFGLPLECSRSINEMDEYRGMNPDTRPSALCFYRDSSASLSNRSTPPPTLPHFLAYF